MTTTQQTASYVTTATGKTAHIGTASKGQVQTLCGIGYSRYARGRALAASTVTPENTCKRCAAMASETAPAEEAPRR